MFRYNALRTDIEVREKLSTKTRLDVRYLVAPILAYALTVWIDPSYTSGDPSLYRLVYDGLGTETLQHGFFFYSVILSSTEPVYYLLVWVLSHLGVPRTLFIGISSGVLAFLSAKLLVRRGASIIIATIITSSTFYFLLLYTTTERLKIAVIFLVASALTVDRPKIAVMFAFLAVAAHIQVAILYFSLLTIYMVNQLRTAIKTGVISPNVIGTVVIVVGVIVTSYFVIGDQIESKAGSYIGLGEQNDLTRVVPFYLITLLYTKERVNVTLIFLPLLVLTPIVGYGRLNIFSYFVLLYYAVEKRKGLNIAIVLTTLYFAYSSFVFVSRIREYGDPILAGQ